MTIFSIEDLLLWRPWLHPLYQKCREEKNKPGISKMTGCLPFLRGRETTGCNASAQSTQQRGGQCFGVLVPLPEGCKARDGGCWSLGNPFCQAGSWCVCLGAPERWAPWGATWGDTSISEPEGTWQCCLKQDLSWNMLGEVLLGPAGCCDFFGTFMRV